MFYINCIIFIDCILNDYWFLKFSRTQLINLKGSPVINFTVSGEQKSSVACEHDKLTISCNDGYYIRIVNALYGRKQQSTCFRAGLVSNTNCAAGSALTVVQSR